MRKSLFGMGLLLCFLFINGMKSIDKPELMARYLVSFTKFIEWPGNMNTGTFSIGVVGDFDIYKAIAKETMGTGIQYRNVDVINLTNIELANSINLNILILTESLSTPENIKKALNVTKSKATLIVTEKPGAINYGSSINFIDKDGKVGFEINKSNVRRNGLQISNRLDVFALKVIP